MEHIFFKVPRFRSLVIPIREILGYGVEQESNHTDKGYLKYQKKNLSERYLSTLSNTRIKLGSN
jgi:hypothetical protein